MSVKVRHAFYSCMCLQWISNNYDSIWFMTYSLTGILLQHATMPSLLFFVDLDTIISILQRYAPHAACLLSSGCWGPSQEQEYYIQQWSLVWKSILLWVVCSYLPQYHYLWIFIDEGNLWPINHINSIVCIVTILAYVPYFNFPKSLMTNRWPDKTGRKKAPYFLPRSSYIYSREKKDVWDDKSLEWIIVNTVEKSDRNVNSYQHCRWTQEFTFNKTGIWKLNLNGTGW